MSYSVPPRNDDEKEEKTLKRKTITSKRKQLKARASFEQLEDDGRAYDLAEAMILDGNNNSLSDAGVGVLALHTCIEGAWMNVLINSVDLKENMEVQVLTTEGKEIMKKSEIKKKELVNLVYEKLLIS